MAQPPTPPFTPSPPGDSRPGSQGSSQQGSDVNYVNTDTGLGGVLIEPEDVSNSQAGIYSYSTGNPSRARDPGTPAPLALRGGNVNVDHTLKDLSKNTKKTLADYMGKKTSVNSYPVDGIPASFETKIAGDSNITPKIPDPGATNSAYHTRTGGNVMGVNLQSVSSPLRGWNVTPVSPDSPDSLVKEAVTKGKSQPESPEALTGDALLRDEPSPALARYQNAVLSSNRFARISEREQTFFLDGSKAKRTRVDKEGVSSVVFEDGKTKMFNPTFHHPRFGSVTAGRLAKVGTALSVGSTLSLAGKKVDVSGLAAGRIISGIGELEASDDSYVSITGGASFGSMNNPLRQFSSSGAIASAVAASSAVVDTVLALCDVLELIFDKSTFSTVKTFTRQMGSSSRNSAVRNILGIPPTLFAVGEAAARGADYFLNGRARSEEFSAVSIDEISGLSPKAATSKMIIRSGKEAMREISSIIKSVGSIAAGSAFVETLRFIKQLADTKLMAALRMFIQQGDALLALEQNFLSENVDEFVSAGRARVHMARVVDKSGEVTSVLPFSTGRAPVVLLLPKSISGFTQDASAHMETPLVGSMDKLIRARYIPAQRIQHGTDATPKTLDEYTVEYMERALDAEYVPFYFHDIRTNEIVSFHAFLESLSDGFSAAYESIEGIGRVEPVRMYKGTQRKIDMTFVVVSTNENDFGVMWEKINKMTTLVYPQYTQGRRHNVGENYSFIQPFSQLVGATPLVRIRLGDLIRSNYSKFALARLFGAELPDTRFNKALPAAVDVTAPEKEVVKGADEKPATITTPPAETAAEQRKEKRERETSDKLFKTRFQKKLKDKGTTAFLLKANATMIRTEWSGIQQQADGDGWRVMMKKSGESPKTRSFDFEILVHRLERQEWDRFADVSAKYATREEYTTEEVETGEIAYVAGAYAESKYKTYANDFDFEGDGQKVQVGTKKVPRTFGVWKPDPGFESFRQDDPGAKGSIVYEEVPGEYEDRAIYETKDAQWLAHERNPGRFQDPSNDQNLMSMEVPGEFADVGDFLTIDVQQVMSIDRSVRTIKRTKRTLKGRHKYKVPIVVWKVRIPWDLHGSSWKLNGASDEAVNYRNKVEQLKNDETTDLAPSAKESIFFVLESDLLPTLKMKREILQTGFTKKYQESVVPPTPEPAAAPAPAATPTPDAAPTPATTEPTTSVQTLTQIEELSRFLDEDKNALVKSFKSASGKGLAGVIESMSFDWMTYQWEVNPGKTAPKACKITISFSPIHDISPGIDSQGYNRAHIYPVFDKSTPGIGVAAEPKKGE